MLYFTNSKNNCDIPRLPKPTSINFIEIRRQYSLVLLLFLILFHILLVLLLNIILEREAKVSPCGKGLGESEKSFLMVPFL